MHLCLSCLTTMICQWIKYRRTLTVNHSTPRALMALLRVATTTAMMKTTSLNLVATKKVQTVIRPVTILKTLGKRRLRLSSAASGFLVKSAKTARRSRAVASPTDKMNSKRRRVSANNTSHQFARTFWSIPPSALTDRDASSSTPLMTLASVKATPI